MNFDLTEEQEMLKTMGRDFMEKEYPELTARDILKSPEGYSPELWKKIANLGWLGMIYPEQYGGMEMGVLDMAILYSGMGRAMFSSPHLSTVVLCGLTILNAGIEEQKTEFLPRIAGGDLIMALAWTESSASWDPDGVAVTARADGDDYVINGTKLFVHDAHIADYILCVTRTRDEGAPEDGITLFLVDAQTPGIEITLLRTMAGNNKQSEVIFNDVRVPKQNMVGPLNGGWAPLFKTMQVGAVMVCAEMVGTGQKAGELAVDYAKTRIQFDQPIGINQYVQEHCIMVFEEVNASRWLMYQAAWKLSQNMPCDIEVAMAKGFGSDSHERAMYRAHQVFAGVGYAVELGMMPLFTRRSRMLMLYLGDSDYWMDKVAGEMDQWPEPERPQGKPLGIFDVEEETVWPLPKK